MYISYCVHVKVSLSIFDVVPNTRFNPTSSQKKKKKVQSNFHFLAPNNNNNKFRVWLTGALRAFVNGLF